MGLVEDPYFKEGAYRRCIKYFDETVESIKYRWFASDIIKIIHSTVVKESQAVAF